MYNQTDLRTSGQLDPKLINLNHNRNRTMQYIINGCRVSFSAKAGNNDEPIKIAKEILLSAYKTRIINSY